MKRTMTLTARQDLQVLQKKLPLDIITSIIGTNLKGKLRKILKRFVKLKFKFFKERMIN